MTEGIHSVKIVAVTGPTATGKTALAVRLCRIFDGEVVSVDSRQVYRNLDIGSGKDLEEYGEIPYHLIDIVDPATEVYHLHRFCRDSYAAIADIHRRGRLPVLCGGSALYLTALLRNYRLPGGELPLRSEGDIRRRQPEGAPPSFTPPFRLESLVLGVYFDRSVVRERIARRLDARLAAGLVDEVRRLHEECGVSLEKLEFFGLEYREAARLLRGECSAAEMRDTLLNRIRQFAKRQDIFFRKMEREGVVIQWLREGREPDPESLVRRFLAGETLPPPALRLSEIRYAVTGRTSK